jgi:hypothetical protein
MHWLLEALHVLTTALKSAPNMQPGTWYALKQIVMRRLLGVRRSHETDVQQNT